jgi:hypothetical protein
MKYIKISTSTKVLIKRNMPQMFVLHDFNNCIQRFIVHTLD